MNGTSACGWRARSNHGTHTGTATARPWQEEGYAHKYLWLYDRAVTSLAEYVRTAPAPRNACTSRFVFSSEYGPWRPGLVGLATSYPFLARARDITSLRGNAPGPDHATFYDVFQCPYGDQELRRLRQLVRSRRYRPGGLRRTGFKQGDKTRILHVPNIRDRVVERAIALAMQVPCEFRFHPRSYGFRPGRTTAHAFGELGRILHQTGRRWLGKADQKDAFDRIPHQRLLDILRYVTREEELVGLVERIVCRPTWRNKQGKLNVGLPQGGPLSPLLFNMYVDHLVDQRLASQHPEVTFLRWADDTLLVCESERQLEEHRKLFQRAYSDAGLALNEVKSTGATATAELTRGESIEYLGVGVSFCDRSLELDLTEECVRDLWDQLLLDILEQQPNVTWNGRRTFIRRLALHTVTSWLEAYAAGIKQDEWPNIRKAITHGISESLPKRLTEAAGTMGNLPIECPSSEELTHAYRQARSKWDHRIKSPIPTPVELFNKRRDAHANTECRPTSPVSLADGADLVPAPLGSIRSHCDVNPGPDEVEWGVEL